MIFLFHFILFLFVLCLFLRSFRNPWKLYMIFGKKGSGKSTYLVRQAVQSLRKGKLVYTNMSELNIAGIRYIDPMDLGDFVPIQDSVLVLDEVGMLWDNRNFKDFKASTRDFFKLQRHYHVTCYLASQTWDIDKKIRDLIDGAFLCVNLFGCLAVNKRIALKWVLTDSTSEAESSIAQNLKFAPIWNWHFCWIPKYVHYYDSFTAPAVAEIPYIDNVDGVALPALLKDNVKREIKQLAQKKDKKTSRSSHHDCAAAPDPDVLHDDFSGQNEQSAQKADISEIAYDDEYFRAFFR